MNMAMFAFDQEKFAGSVSKDPKRLILISTPFWAIDPKFHTVIEDWGEATSHATCLTAEEQVGVAFWFG